MASPELKFMEEHKDFVLKLKIKATDGTSQIRRVRLPRIADKNGALSYDELEGLVVTFTFPNPEDAPDVYSVSLTYFDVDEDTVTIGSTDELVDAIEQFSGKKVLRISTEVKPSTKSEGHTARKKPPPPPSQTAANNQDDSSKRDHTKGQTHPQVQNLLESFVGVLATAVNSLQEGIAAPEAAATPKSSPTVHASAQAAAGPKMAPPTTDSDEGEVKSKAAPPRDMKETPVAREAKTEPPTQAASEGEAKGEEEEMDNDARPFIHGRHTCDSCLTTPIVGKRYNAKNLPDYDLCENCHKNYKGNEVQFEVVELDRDRPFQDRWHRRRERIRNTRNPQGGAARRFGGRRFEGGRRWSQRRSGSSGSGTSPKPKEAPQVHPPSDPPSQRTEPQITQEEPEELPREPEVAPPMDDQRPDPFCPPPPPPPRHPFFGGPPPPPYAPPMPPHWSHIGPHVLPHLDPHFRPHGHSHWPPHAPPPPPPPRVPRTNGEFDDALKEAIMRSLRDIAPHEVADTEAPVEERRANATVEVATETDGSSGSSPGDAIIDVSSDEAADLPVEESVEVNCVEDAASEEEKKDDRTPEEASAASDTSAAENIVSLGVEVDVSPSNDAPSKASSVGVDTPAEVDTGISAETVISVPDWEQEDAEVTDCESADESLGQKVKQSPRKSRDTTVDESFASDAVGNGDVAEAMGATLDMVAGVISDMLSEADSYTKAAPDQEQQTVFSGSAGKVPGALIVDSAANSHKTEESGEDDWEVVKKDSKDETTEGSPDEEIGNAAMMLGSALFNSDMQASSENADVDVSTLSHSDSFSVPSTVPSLTSNDGVSPAQRARWSSQLTTLRELGFEEAQCVETLERLQAANIGVGAEEDDISVTHVIDAIVGPK